MYRRFLGESLAGDGQGGVFASPFNSYETLPKFFVMFKLLEVEKYEFKYGDEEEFTLGLGIGCFAFADLVCNVG